MLVLTVILTLALRVEWTKAKAWHEHWWEEAVLLDEEMRCVQQFCESKQLWWRDQLGLRDLRANPDTTLAEGLHAYATEQAGIEVQIAADWSEKWSIVRGIAQAIIKEEPGWEIEVDHVRAETIIEVWLGDGDEGDEEDY